MTPLVLLSLLLFADEPALKRFSYDEPHMGTRFRVIVYAADEAVASKAARAAFTRATELNAILSDYDPASELMKLCAKSGGDPVPVGPELLAVLSKAQKVAEASDGAFDATVGPMARLWRLSRRTQRLPEADDLAAARALVGYKNVKLDPKDRTVQLLKKGMRLDLGGIAKGYTADQMQAVLKKHGIDRALVACGGDIVVTRPPPGEDGWKVGIAPREGPDDDAPVYLVLRDAAVSTSGDTNQFVEIGGKRYSHVVDPRTGLGLTDRTQVTVVAKRGIDSDSLTKVACVLGADKGLKLIEQAGASGRVVRPAEKGEEVITSKTFPKTHERPKE